jgi:hypothetical protein
MKDEQLAPLVHDYLGYGWSADGEPLTTEDVVLTLARLSGELKALDLIEGGVAGLAGRSVGADAGAPGDRAGGAVVPGPGRLTRVTGRPAGPCC